MDKYIIKNIILTSLILGLILGIFASIPFAGIFFLFVLLLLAAPLVLVYLIMAGELDLTCPRDGIIYGAICGFSSSITFSAAYSVIIVLMAVIFNYTPNLFLSAIIVNSPIWLLTVCIIFIGFLPATTNALSGFTTHYVIEFIRDMYERKENK